MNLSKILDKEQIELLRKNNIIIQDRELNENEMISFYNSLFEHGLTQIQQEEIFDTIDDYEKD